MRTTDLDEIEAAIAGLPLDLQRLTTDEGSVGVTSTACGDVDMLAGELGFPIVTQGDIAGDSLVVALQLEAGAGHWNGHEFSLDRAWFYRPGSEHFGVGPGGRGCGPPRFATVSVPTAKGSRRHVDGSDSPTTSSMVVEDRRVRNLRILVTDLLAAGSSAALAGERTDRAKGELIELLDELQADAKPTLVGRSSATRIAQRSIEVADTVDPMPTMAELASAIGLSDRWIRAAFHQVYGIAPSAFFRARAMNGAHRQLRSAPPESATVTEVAMAWGFWHLGRFSAAYRSYFGELPSETLARVD